MSRKVLSDILASMGIRLTMREFEELRQELWSTFGLVGGQGDCAALDSMWSDPDTRAMIQDFIAAWMQRRRQRKAEREAYEAIAYA